MIKLVITLAAAAAIIVPAAHGADNQIVGPDDRSQPRATSPALLPDSPSPDDRAFNRAVSPALQPQSQGPDDRALPRETPTQVQVIVRQPHGFDWADAATGAAAAIGFAAIVAALALLAARSRRSQGPSPTPKVEST